MPETAKAERYEKLLVALDRLQDKGVWGVSYLTLYAPRPKSDKVEIKLDKNGNFVVRICREFFEPISVAQHFLNRLEKKDLDDIERAYLKTKKFLDKNSWKYIEDKEYLSVNTKFLVVKKSRQRMRAFAFSVAFAKEAEDLLEPVDKIFLFLFGLPRNYIPDTGLSMK